MKGVVKMRAVAFSAWVFINLIILAMCGYVYLLWSQYWLYVARHQHTQPIEKHLHIVNNRNVYANQVIYFNQEPSSLSSGDSSQLQQPRRNHRAPAPPRRSFRSKTSSTPTSWPRHRRPSFISLNMSQNQNWSSTSGPHLDKETSRILTYRNQLMVQLRRVLLEESSVFKTKRYQNPYNVKYNGPRGALASKTAKHLLCKLKASPVRTIVASNPPFNRLTLGKLLPKTQMADPFVEPKFNTCAVVTNAGSLHGSGLGTYIDSHEAVMRFNHAPTEGHEQDVGTKTTIRVVNSQVVTKQEFAFQINPLYQGVTIVAWDPSNYSASLDEWQAHPEYDVFTALEEYLSSNSNHRAYLIDPRSVWSVWDLLQQFSSVRLRRNPPSSGFLGISLMLAECRHVSVLEYVPSVRLTKRCHYWETTDDSSCTFGVWHPLAAEKLMTIVMNTASDYDVYQRGIVSLPGFYQTRC